MDESHSTPSQTERELARLREEIKSLRSQQEDSRETLRAIQEGAVDALVIDTPEGQRVFTIEGGDHPYRALIEQMREGAVTLTPDGVIHYCNGRFAEMLKLPLERIMGGRIEEFVVPADRALLAGICSETGGRAELALLAGDSREVPALVSAILLRTEGPAAVCLVVADLTERKRHEAEIHQLNDELEERVTHRTSQLATANRELEEEIADRKRAEQALRESEQRFRLALKNSPVSVAIQDRNLVYQWAFNQQSRRPDEIIGKTDADLFASEEVVWINEVKQRVLETGKEVHVEHWVTSNGRRLFLGLSYEPLRDSAGQVTGIGIAVVDLTSQKLAEDALRESESRLRLAQESANVGIWDWKVETGELDFTPELNKLYGLPNGSIKTYQDWRDRVHPDDIGRVEVDRDEAIAKHEPFDLEFRGHHSSEEYRWISTKGGAVYNEAGKAIRVFGVNIDITECKRAEEALRTSEARYRDLAELIPAMVWAADTQGVTIDHNRRWREYTGQTSEQARGDGWEDIVHPDDVRRVCDRWGQSIQTGEDYSNEYRLRRASDGAY